MSRAAARPPPNPVEPADLLEFERYVVAWQARLNLSDWRIERCPKRVAGSMASVMRSLPDRLAIYRIGRGFGAAAVTPYSLETTAVHELLHVFLYELVELARDPATTEAALESAEHRVVNVLEKLLVPSRAT